MCTDGMENTKMNGMYCEDGNGHRVVKRYWLFDTESGALSIPADSDDTNGQAQGED